MNRRDVIQAGTAALGLGLHAWGNAQSGALLKPGKPYAVRS